MLDCEPLPARTDVQSLLQWADKKRSLLLGSHQVEGRKDHLKYVKPSLEQNLTGNSASSTEKYNKNSNSVVYETHNIYSPQDVKQLRRSAPLQMQGVQRFTKEPKNTSTQQSTDIADEGTGVLSSPRRKIQAHRRLGSLSERQTFGNNQTQVTSSDNQRKNLVANQNSSSVPTELLRKENKEAKETNTKTITERVPVTNCENSNADSLVVNHGTILQKSSRTINQETHVKGLHTRSLREHNVTNTRSDDGQTKTFNPGVPLNFRGIYHRKRILKENSMEINRKLENSTMQPRKGNLSKKQPLKPLTPDQINRLIKEVHLGNINKTKNLQDIFSSKREEKLRFQVRSTIREKTPDGREIKIYRPLAINRSGGPLECGNKPQRRVVLSRDTQCWSLPSGERPSKPRLEIVHNAVVAILPENTRVVLPGVNIESRITQSRSRDVWKTQERNCGYFEIKHEGGEEVDLRKGGKCSTNNRMHGVWNNDGRVEEELELGEIGNDEDDRSENHEIASSGIDLSENNILYPLLSHPTKQRWNLDSNGLESYELELKDDQIKGIMKKKSTTANDRVMVNSNRSPSHITATQSESENNSMHGSLFDDDVKEKEKTPANEIRVAEGTKPERSYLNDFFNFEESDGLTSPKGVICNERVQNQKFETDQGPVSHRPRRPQSDKVPDLSMHTKISERSPDNVVQNSTPPVHQSSFNGKGAEIGQAMAGNANVRTAVGNDSKEDQKDEDRKMDLPRVRQNNQDNSPKGRKWQKATIFSVVNVPSAETGTGDVISSSPPANNLSAQDQSDLEHRFQERDAITKESCEYASGHAENSQRIRASIENQSRTSQLQSQLQHLRQPQSQQTHSQQPQSQLPQSQTQQSHSPKSKLSQLQLPQSQPSQSSPGKSQTTRGQPPQWGNTITITTCPKGLQRERENQEKQNKPLPRKGTKSDVAQNVGRALGPGNRVLIDSKSEPGASEDADAKEKAALRVLHTVRAPEPIPIGTSDSCLAEDDQRLLDGPADGRQKFGEKVAAMLQQRLQLLPLDRVVGHHRIRPMGINTLFRASTLMREELSGLLRAQLPLLPSPVDTSTLTETDTSVMIDPVESFAEDSKEARDPAVEDRAEVPTSDKKESGPEDEGDTQADSDNIYDDEDFDESQNNSSGSSDSDEGLEDQINQNLKGIPTIEQIKSVFREMLAEDRIARAEDYNKESRREVCIQIPSSLEPSSMSPIVAGTQFSSDDEVPPLAAADAETQCPSAKDELVHSDPTDVHCQSNERPSTFPTAELEIQCSFENRPFLVSKDVGFQYPSSADSDSTSRAIGNPQIEPNLSSLVALKSQSQSIGTPVHTAPRERETDEKSSSVPEHVLSREHDQGHHEGRVGDESLDTLEQNQKVGSDQAQKDSPSPRPREDLSSTNEMSVVEGSHSISEGEMLMDSASSPARPAQKLEGWIYDLYHKLVNDSGLSHGLVLESEAQSHREPLSRPGQESRLSPGREPGSRERNVHEKENLCQPSSSAEVEIDDSDLNRIAEFGIIHNSAKVGLTRLDTINESCCTNSTDTRGESQEESKSYQGKEHFEAGSDNDTVSGCKLVLADDSDETIEISPDYSVEGLVYDGNNIMGERFDHRQATCSEGELEPLTGGPSDANASELIVSLVESGEIANDPQITSKPSFPPPPLSPGEANALIPKATNSIGCSLGKSPAQRGKHHAMLPYSEAPSTDSSGLMANQSPKPGPTESPKASPTTPTKPLVSVDNSSIANKLGFGQVAQLIRQSNLSVRPKEKIPRLTKHSEKSSNIQSSGDNVQERISYPKFPKEKSAGNIATFPPDYPMTSLEQAATRSHNVQIEEDSDRSLHSECVRDFELFAEDGKIILQQYAQQKVPLASADEGSLEISDYYSTPQICTPRRTKFRAIFEESSIPDRQTEDLRPVTLRKLHHDEEPLPRPRKDAIGQLFQKYWKSTSVEAKEDIDSRCSKANSEGIKHIPSTPSKPLQRSLFRSQITFGADPEEDVLSAEEKNALLQSNKDLLTRLKPFERLNF